MSTRQAFTLASRRAAAARRPPPRHFRQLATAAPGEAKAADSSHLLAGLGGGAVVLLGVYGYYHYSGAAKVVNTAKSVSQQAASAKDTLVGAAPSPKQAVDMLRSLSKTYVAAFPGAAAVVDQTFDQLERLAEAHGDEAKKLFADTYAEVEKAVKDGKGSGEKVVAALQQAAVKVQKLVQEQGGKALDKLYEKAPELKKVMGTGSDELQKLADKHGPEARKIAEDTYAQAYDLVQNGGLNAKTYERVKELFAQKSQEISKLAQKSGKDAWDASAKAAGPYLDKMPDVQKLVQEKLGDLEGLAGEDNVKVVKDIYSELEKIGKSGKSVDEMTKDAKKLLESKAGSFSDLKKKAQEGLNSAKDAAQSKGGDLAAYAAAVPGLGGLTKVFDSNTIKQIKELSEKHGDEAEKLLESTYKELKEVIEKKLQEGKKLADNATGDVKKEVKK